MFDYLNDESDNQSINHVPNTLIVFFGGMNGVAIIRRRYPEFLENANSLSPIHNIDNCLPQTLWLCGTAEKDYEQNRTLVNKMVMEGMI